MYRDWTWEPIEEPPEFWYLECDECRDKLEQEGQMIYAEEREMLIDVAADYGWLCAIDQAVCPSCLDRGRKVAEVAAGG